MKRSSMKYIDKCSISFFSSNMIVTKFYKSSQSSITGVFEVKLHSVTIEDNMEIHYKKRNVGKLFSINT